MQITLDGRILGPQEEADWVDSWADGLGLLPPVDAFVLGGGMFGGYEQFWTAILEEQPAAAEMLGRDPYPRERAYARTAAETPHLVVSTTLTETSWPSARIVRDVEAVHDAAGDSAYVVGGPTLLASLIHARLLDELHLIVHPVLAGGGTDFFTGARGDGLELVTAEPMEAGRVHLAYRA